MINQAKLDQLIIRHKKIMGVIANKYKGSEEKVDEISKADKDIIGAIESTGKKITILVSNFKCQKCKTEENLTIHHLILRYAKEFMGFWRYASQRYYWANMIVLCKKCHRTCHGIERQDDDDMLAISPELIKQLKEEFDDKPKEVKSEIL
jgi:5-methylcytosine-specific restriction endonuclease McrA